MRKMKRSDIPVLIIAGVILIGVLAGIVTMICGALEKKKLEPSADYYGLTVLEAMYLECEARGLSISDEELAALEAQALEDQRQYALTGEHVSYDDLLEELKFDFLFERLRLALPLEDNITDAQVQEWYDVRLAALNNAFQEEPGIFKSQQDLYDKHGASTPWAEESSEAMSRSLVTSFRPWPSFKKGTNSRVVVPESTNRVQPGLIMRAAAAAMRAFSSRLARVFS